MSRMLSQGIALFLVSLLAVFGLHAAECEFFNQTVIESDGDLQLILSQVDRLLKVQMRSDTGTSPAALDSKIFFDLDRDQQTGRRYVVGEDTIGVDLIVEIDSGDPVSTVLWLKNNGALNSKIPGPLVSFFDRGFAIFLEVEELGSSEFDVLSSTTESWGGFGSVSLVDAETEDDWQLVFESSHMVFRGSPILVNIPDKETEVALRVYRVEAGHRDPVEADEVSFVLDHPFLRVYPDSELDPHRIVNIDAACNAHYLGEGFVIATPTVEHCGGLLRLDQFVIANGDVYGSPGEDSVIAVFPTDYQPEGSCCSFGDMMSSYPNCMQLVNTAFDVTSEMYGGAVPYDGATQIFALVDVPDHCGMNGNPLLTAPGCYMNFGDGSPQYNVMVHEMGHNFSFAPNGMRMLLAAESDRIADMGFIECVASLPIIYLEQEIVSDPAGYGLHLNDFEVSYYQGNIDHYCPDSEAGLQEFEAMIDAGQTDGIFDNPGLFDGVRVSCSFFQQFSCGYTSGANPYRHQMIRRFLRIFGEGDMPALDWERVDTIFAAAFSAAAGVDMKERLAYWGFEIDDSYYETILPLVKARLPDGERPSVRYVRPSGRIRPVSTKN